MKSQRITRHWTELSAYMDGQLPPNKAAHLEKRLSRDSELRAEYEDLLRTRSLLRRLPPRRVPRNFTLTPDMVRAPRRRISGFLVPALRFSSSFAAFMLVLTFALDFMGTTLKMGTMAQEAAPAMEMMMEEAPAEMTMEKYAEEAEEEPMILLWDEQPEPGLGGGIARKWKLPWLTQPKAKPCRWKKPPPQPKYPCQSLQKKKQKMAMEAPVALAEELPAANAALPATATPTPMGTARIAAEEEAPREETADGEKAYIEESVDSVILGIPPEEEQGHIQATEPPSPLLYPSNADASSLAAGCKSAWVHSPSLPCSSPSSSRARDIDETARGKILPPTAASSQKINPYTVKFVRFVPPANGSICRIPRWRLSCSSSRTAKFSWCSATARPSKASGACRQAS